MIWTLVTHSLIDWKVYNEEQLRIYVSEAFEA